MKHSSPWIVEPLLLAAVLGLGWLALAPQPPRRPAAPRATAEASAAPAPVEAAGSFEAAATPPQVAALFGWKPPAAASAGGPGPAPAPARPQWLSQLGYVVESDGPPSYAFKDARSGAVFSLRPGQENRGWRLLEVRGNTFLLESAGQRYVVEGGKTQ